jgi:hypothetical protein
MSDESEEKVVGMDRRTSALLSKLDHASARQERTRKSEPGTVNATADDADTLPGIEDDYAACSRPDNKPQLMLSLLKADESIKSLSYSDLRWVDLKPGDKPGNGPGLVLRFVGVAEVRIEGRCLRPLVDDLRRHRIGWLRELPAGRDFRDANTLVITRLDVHEVGTED